MNLLVTISLLISSLFNVNSDTTKVSSSIENVTVFRTQAQIERKASVDLKSGRNVIIFSELSSGLNQNSIQLKGKGAFTILSLSTKNNYEEIKPSNPQITALNLKKDSLQNQIANLRSKIKVIDSNIRLLNSSNNIANNHKLSAAELDALLELQSKKLLEYETSKNSSQKSINDLNTKIRLINEQIRELGAVRRNNFKEIIAEVEVNENQRMDFQLQYLVNNAGWSPAYDVRSIDTDSPLEIDFKARVYQNTGYDWENINFTIDSGDPTISIQKPELDTNFAFFTNSTIAKRNRNQPQLSSTATISRISSKGTLRGSVIDKEYGEEIAGATVFIPEIDRGLATDALGRFTINGIPNGVYKVVVSFVGYNTYEGMVSFGNSGIELNVQMATSFTGLEELVVSGYAITPESENRGFDVQVRGNTNLAAVSDPLYVVDGQITTEGLDSINPDDIESLEVLKDEEAVALYGSRGASGVVIITTKNYAGNNIQNSEVNNQTSFSYKISEPYSVPSDGKEHTLNIKKEQPNTRYQYFAVPKLTKKSFLIAKISDWSEMNLIAGPTNIYFEDSYVGENTINPDITLDSLAFSLGVDERIIVNRKKLKDFEERRFFGSKVRESLSFEISIRNTKSEVISISVEDQIPITTDESIKVSPKELSGGEIDEETGIITWNLSVKPNETKKLKLNFEIEYPKGKRVSY